MDVDYSNNLHRDGNPDTTFKQSLFVLTRVMSKSAGRLVVDAGMKAVSHDSGPPRVIKDLSSLTPLDPSQVYDLHKKKKKKVVAHNLHR